MTREEMHAMIAQKLEGWQWCCVRPPRKSYERYRAFAPEPFMGHVVCTEQEMQELPASWKFSVDCPNYSADLNLCARVEHRIAKLGMFRAYAQLLVGGITGVEQTDDSVTWTEAEVAMRAPASARVEAMCALIQSMEEAK